MIMEVSKSTICSSGSRLTLWFLSQGSWLANSLLLRECQAFCSTDWMRPNIMEDILLYSVFTDLSVNLI